MVVQTIDITIFYLSGMAMQFDTGTWWLIGIIVTALLGALAWFMKRSLDRIEKKLDETVSKAEYSKDTDEMKRDIREVKENYTPQAVHERDFEKCRKDITEIRDNYLTREDFYREQAKTERKLDQILDILMKRGQPG